MAALNMNKFLSFELEEANTVRLTIDLKKVLAQCPSALSALMNKLSIAGIEPNDSAALLAIENTLLTATFTVHGKVEAGVLTSFRVFPKLPGELRRKIWKYTLEPRIAEVRVSRRDKYEESQNPYRFRSPAPIPKVLQVHQESRNEFLKHYEKLFYQFDDGAMRYVLINPKVDIIYLSPLTYGIGNKESPFGLICNALTKMAVYQSSHVDKITHLAIPLPWTSMHAEKTAQGLVHCTNLTHLQLLTNHLPCTWDLERMRQKRGSGKLWEIDNENPRERAGIPLAFALNLLLGLLESHIAAKGTVRKGMTRLPTTISIGQLKAVENKQ